MNKKDTKEGFYAKRGKRALDLVISLPLLIILSPLILLISILIKCDSEGSVLFTQLRVGRSGRVFKFYKFRSMIKDADKKGPYITSSDDKRVTPLGKILRKYKLDEIPQILNVIKGDMSLVGPRPWVKKVVDEFQGDDSLILSIRPGITGYASLMYRNEEEILVGYDDVEYAHNTIILPQKVAFCKKYITEMSFITDLKILFGTFRELIKF